VDRDDIELGISRQREDCLKRCAAKGWHAPIEYGDNDIPASTELLDDLRRTGSGALPFLNACRVEPS